MISKSGEANCAENIKTALRSAQRMTASILGMLQHTEKRATKGCLNPEYHNIQFTIYYMVRQKSFAGPICFQTSTTS